MVVKVYISADLEGVCGVVQTEGPEGADHNLMRRLMTGEVNAAVEGALNAGAAEVLVNDSHGGMRNLLVEELHERALLITGRPKPLLMMEGIGSGFDAACFIGYHAMKGTTQAVLSHTITGLVNKVVVNGRPLGETGLNAGIAGYFNVPVALLTGDRAVTEEARKLLGRVETVAVKEAVGRSAARCLSPKRAREMIREAAKRALSNLQVYRPLRFEPPIRLELEFTETTMADSAELIPGFQRVNATSLSYTAEDYITAFRALLVAISLARGY